MQRHRGLPARWLAIPAIVVTGFSCGRSGSPGDGGGDPVASPGPTHVAEPARLPLVVESAGTVLNACAAVVAGSASTLTIAGGSAAFPAGLRVVVMQVQDDFAVPGDGGPIAASGSAGLFVEARVVASGAGSLALEAPLGAVFGSAGTRRAQVCTLPAFTDVFVLTSASIVAPAWDGTTGGFVGLIASGALHVDGAISADGAGFRGGLRYGSGGGADETDLVSIQIDRYGGIGEGLDRRSWTQVGVGNRANAGGGGGAYNSGGGGGGSAGAGGRGASQNAPDPVNPATAGRAGAAFAIDSRLSFGGGGGAGHQNQSVGGDGGSGGGLVFLVVERLAGAGVISANGADGGDSENSSGDVDGAGGGGAGGSLNVTAGELDFAGTLRADGGAGGDIDDMEVRPGVGGGGGGGLVRVSATTVTQAGTRSVAGGRTGANPANDTHDSQPGAVGVEDVQ